MEVLDVPEDVYQEMQLGKGGNEEVRGGDDDRESKTLKRIRDRQKRIESSEALRKQIWKKLFGNNPYIRPEK